MTKVSRRQFAIFKKECLRWLRFFMIGQWSIYYSHTSLGNNAFGKINWNYTARAATIKLCKDWPCDWKPTNDHIRLVAFHEVVDLLLADVREFATRNTRIPTDEIESRFHHLTRTLERIIFMPTLKKPLSHMENWGVVND